MKFFSTIELLRIKPPPYRNPFVLQWEIPNPKTDAVRKYAVFNGIEEYIPYIAKNRYITCHEVFIASNYNINEEFAGHPVFDIDIHLGENETLPSDWIKLLQEDIIYVLNNQYPDSNIKNYLLDKITIPDDKKETTNDVNIYSTPSNNISSNNIEFANTHVENLYHNMNNVLNETKSLINYTNMLINEIDDNKPIIESNKKYIPDKNIKTKNPWVWMTSNSPGKISKHLVIGSIVFSTWRSQMKLLVSGLKDLSDDIRKSSSIVIKAIDDAITRKSGSLRLPLNAKVSNLDAKIIFDDINHKFLDGIVLIHDENMYTLSGGILLTYNDIADIYKSQCTYINASTNSKINKYNTISDETSNELIDAFNRLSRKIDTGLETADINGNILQLKRVKPGICLISGKTHESDNAYVFKNGGDIYYACHRGCSYFIEGKEHKYTRIYLPSKKGEDLAKKCDDDVTKMENKDI